ncbi:MAG: NAD(P)/FAD-dependent oxidoreductase [Thermoleophilaceae bacterium]
MSAARRRVVIVGGGFGGLAAAHKLRRAHVDVTLVDRTNHHLFQPLLYQLAGGAISEGDCAAPIRMALKRSSNTKVVMAAVTEVDAEQRQVVLDRGERLDYDSLVVACGARTSYFGHEEWQGVSCGLKTLTEAVELRNRIYAAFEEADRAEDDASRQEWMTFVVVGGGATGVEVAGALGLIAGRREKSTWTRIDPADARVILLDAGERVVPAFSQKLSAKAALYLAELGVTVREGARATAIDRNGVTVEVSGRAERIAARTVIWAAGVRAAELTDTLAAATEVTTDRSGRIEVRPDLTLPGYPEISAIGDMTTLAGPGDKPLPGLATVAIQQARHVAKAIRGGQPGASTPFRYFDKGALAVVGRGKAVCEVRGLELAGRPAFMTYLGVHLYYLGGGVGRRLGVLTDWVTARLGRPHSPVIEGDLNVSAARIGEDRPARNPVNGAGVPGPALGERSNR